MDTTRSLLLLLATLSLFCGTVFANYWRTCQDFPGGKFKKLSVSVTGCNSTEDVCPLATGTNGTIQITFKSEENTTHVYNNIYTYGRKELGPDGCDIGVKCPVVAGSTQTERIAFDIPAIAPPVTFDMVFELLDDRRIEQGCVEIKMKIA